MLSMDDNSASAFFSITENEQILQSAAALATDCIFQRRIDDELAITFDRQPRQRRDLALCAYWLTAMRATRRFQRRRAGTASPVEVRNAQRHGRRAVPVAFAVWPLELCGSANATTRRQIA